MRFIAVILAIATLGAAASPALERARELYLRTEYRESLDLLNAGHPKDAATLQLIGQNYFMLGEYKKGTEALEKAVSLEPQNAAAAYWLGRTYARRAETANPFS